MKQFVRNQSGAFQDAARVTFVDDLHKTATVKVQKYILRGRGTSIVKQ